MHITVKINIKYFKKAKNDGKVEKKWTWFLKLFNYKQNYY